MEEYNRPFHKNKIKGFNSFFMFKDFLFFFFHFLLNSFPCQLILENLILSSDFDCDVHIQLPQLELQEQLLID